MNNEYNAERHVEGLRATIKRLESEKYNLSDKLSKKRDEAHKLKAENKSLAQNSRELAQLSVGLQKLLKAKSERYSRLNRLYVMLWGVVIFLCVIDIYLLYYGN